MITLLGTAVLLWQLASGPVSGDVSTTGIIQGTAPPPGSEALAPEVRASAVGSGLYPDPATGGAVLPDTATVVTGTASWYCGGGSRCTRGYPGGLYAAAGPALRVGDWRGRRVTVCSGSRCVAVKLIDVCACPSRVIDLYRDAFSRLASPSRGVLRVSVTWGSDEPVGTLPPTSTGDAP